jgi:vacuolar-type H+-ATPase subunit C/Vma6
LAKAAATDVSEEAVTAHLSKLGVFAPEYMKESAATNSLNRLEQDWQEAYDDAVRAATADDLEAVDRIMDELYFATAARVVQVTQDAFLCRFFKRMIDIHNLKSRLRTLTYPNVAFGASFISGGNYAASEIETKEQVLATYEKMGMEAHWRDAIEYYTATNNTTRLDARAGDYLLSLTREAAYNMFSSASLVLFFLRSQQAADNIRTILVGLNSGMKEADIRANLRTAYVD